MPNQLLVSTPQAAQWATAGGQRSIGPFTISGALGIAEEFTIPAMANGDNIFAVPAGAQGVLIIPPTGNNTALTFRTNGPDVGVPINRTQPKTEIFDLTVPPANVIVNSAGGFAGPLTAIFF